MNPRASICRLLSLNGISMVLVIFVPKTLLLDEVLLVCASPALLPLCLLARANPATHDGSDGIALAPLIRRTKEELEQQLRSYEVPVEFLRVDCGICQDEYPKGDMIVESPSAACVHQFYKSCISQWLLAENRECPICRRDYLKTAEKVQEEVNREQLRKIRDEKNIEVDLEVGNAHSESERELVLDSVQLHDESTEQVPLTSAAT